MTTPRDIDRDFRSYFDGRAVGQAPDGLLDTALAGVASTRQRPSLLVADRWRPRRLVSRAGLGPRVVAVVTVLLFFAMGVGIGAKQGLVLGIAPGVPGMAAGVAIALIFWLRMRIEELGGKEASRQASMAGFETEDILYLLPLVTLCNGVEPFLVAASIGAPLFAAWVVFDYRRLVRRLRPQAEQRPVGAA